MFRIVVKAYNCEKWIAECLRSLQAQIGVNWSATVIIDAGEDRTFSAAAPFASPGKIDIYCSATRLYGTRAVHKGIRLSGADAGDIICIVDGDDRLAREDALLLVQREYDQTNCLVTYGSFSRVSTGNKCPYFEAYRKDLPIRMEPWQASHLKTFRYDLYTAIPAEYIAEVLQYRYCNDMALMFALVELAGWDRVEHISEVLYEYNDRSKDNIFRTSLDESKRIEQILRQMKPLNKKNI